MFSFVMARLQLDTPSVSLIQTAYTWLLLARVLLVLVKNGSDLTTLHCMNGAQHKYAALAGVTEQQSVLIKFSGTVGKIHDTNF
jgi:hypothetical protein